MKWAHKQKNEIVATLWVLKGYGTGERTNLVVATVQHIPQLHHHSVASHPGGPVVVILQHTRELERVDGLRHVAVDVAHCRKHVLVVSTLTSQRVTVSKRMTMREREYYNLFT